MAADRPASLLGTEYWLTCIKGISLWEIAVMEALAHLFAASGKRLTD